MSVDWANAHSFWRESIFYRKGEARVNGTAVALDGIGVETGNYIGSE